MNILLIGSGAREHALAWKILQSPKLTQLYMTATNGSVFILNKNSAKPVFAVNIAESDHDGLLKFAQEKDIKLVVIGSEAPLAAGLTNQFNKINIAVFGPTQEAAQIESSKAFAKEFMQRHHIPTARFARFTDLSAALDYVGSIDYPIVIKASGLAAGKGVYLPSDLAESEKILRSLLLDHALGKAGEEIIIEERLIGEEISLLGFSDGVTITPLPLARDHKRLLAGNQGPNTGGMGAFAPAPLPQNYSIEELTTNILQPTIDALRAENKPFVGVLYAGLMLTTEGASVLEFNCRFGDPETQVLMPLLDSDLVDIMLACTQQQLKDCAILWKTQTAVCVVLASEGYPEKPQTGEIISGLEPTDLPGAPVETELVKTATSIDKLADIQTVKKDIEGYAQAQNAVIFHAGTRWQNEQLFTAGGRVVSITAWDDNLTTARARAYAHVKAINFKGMQYRDDIGV